MPLALLRAWADARGIALHTVQVVRDGETLAEATSVPFTLDTPHRMYSVAKSVTALAIGVLAGEGAIELDDTVVQHFPDQRPVHPFLKATTIRDVLSMRGPHRSTTYKRYDGPWVESWFRVPPTHRPGTLFTYDTSGIHVLAALIERTTGLSLGAYLRPRILDPLGVSAAFDYLPGPDGHSSGGSGLVCTARDLRLLAQLVLAGGMWHGSALVPGWFVRAATARQADTALQNWGHQLQGGYGYQTWLPRVGGWLMFGLGGQLVYGDAAHDLAVVITADTQTFPGGDQGLVDLVLGQLVPAWLARDAVPEAAALAWPGVPHNSALARDLQGWWHPIEGGEMGSGSLRVETGGAGGVLTCLEATGQTPVWKLAFAFDGPTRTPACELAASQGLPGPAVVTAGWTAPDTLDIRVDAVGDELGALRLRLVVTDDGLLTVRRQGFGETLDAAWNAVGTYRLNP